MYLRSFFLLLAASLLGLVGVVPAHAAIEVGQPRWGFDGRVVPDVFNLVSVEVRNTGAAEFQGVVSLNTDGGAGVAPMRRELFLSPGATQWVQFYAYPPQWGNEWKLSWQDKEGRGGSANFSSGSRGASATVALVSGAFPPRNVRLPLFPEELFPPSVAGLGGLSTLVMDHAPRWPDEARSVALLDWIKKGGTLHVVPGPDGVMPHFTGMLEGLNIEPGKRKQLEAGLVAAHKEPLSEITEGLLRSRGFFVADYVNKNDGNQITYDVDGFIARKLAAVTKPKIAWGFIYTLTLVYIVLIGPVFFYLRRKDYRMLLGGFLLTVVLFAWMFTEIGRRGYGEKQVFHSVSVARSLGDGRFDVSTWGHAFATQGGEYRLQFPGTGHVYAVTDQSEGLKSGIQAQSIQGGDACLLATMPLFSGRSLLHRGVLKGPNLEAGIATQAVKAPATKPGVSVPSQIRINPEILKGFQSGVLQYRDAFYKVDRGDDVLTVSSTGRGAADFFADLQNQLHDYGWGGESAEAAQRRLRDMGRLLVARVAHPTQMEREYVTVSPPTQDHARLYIYTSAPADFSLQNKEFATGLGLVLYVQDIALP